MLDNNKKLSTDFSKDLDNDLKSMLSGVRHRKGFKMSAFSFVLIGIAFVGVFFYTGFINSVHNYEQRINLRAWLTPCTTIN